MRSPLELMLPLITHPRRAHVEAQSTDDLKKLRHGLPRIWKEFKAQYPTILALLIQ